MLKLIQKLKDNWRKAQCTHKRALETNRVQPFTIGKITGQVPVFICPDCKLYVQQTINA